MSAPADVAAGPALPKAPTGDRGLDEITRGGTGSGKSLLGLQFLVAGLQLRPRQAGRRD